MVLFQDGPRAAIPAEDERLLALLKDQTVFNVSNLLESARGIDESGCL